MNHSFKSRFYMLVLMTGFIVTVMLAVPPMISAQESATPTPVGTPIQITGVVSEIEGNTIIVAGLTVDASSLELDEPLELGNTVTVTGHVSNSVVVAITIVIVDLDSTPTPTPTPGTPTATPDATQVTPTPSATPDPNSGPIIVIEGPIINIVTNIITIYSFDIEVEPQNPILTIINIGDVVRVHGAFGPHNRIVANVVSNIPTSTITTTTVAASASVGLDGPVDAINGNLITVNGITVQLSANDPRLSTLQLGDFVQVQGNFQNSGTTIVLVVVNITVINNVTIIQNDCWFHDDGMGMGHWHCDGMGMGMGMGDSMGMGR